MRRPLGQTRTPAIGVDINRPCLPRNVLAAVIAAILLSTGLSSFASPAPVADALASRQAVEKAAGSVAPRPSPGPVPPSGLDQALFDLTRARNESGEASATNRARVSDLKLSGDQVAAEVEAAPGSTREASAEVAAAGGVVRQEHDGVLDTLVPVKALIALAAEPSIRRVRRPTVPFLADTVSEGAAVVNASAWTRSGAVGSGVKVGIIDGGFKGYANLLGTDLPPSVHLWSGVPGKPETVIGAYTTEEYHGTAVAEIVHDVAPGAELYFARISDADDLASAKDWMVANGVRVINHSVSWLGERLNGGGFVNKIVDEAVRTTAVPGGVNWVNAAGNMRDRHWGGNFTARRDDPTTLRWGAGQYANLVPWRVGDPPLVGLLWWNNDDWGGWANQDYDLILFRFNGREFVEVASSRTPQTGGASQYPSEQVVYFPSQTGWYGWAIYRKNTRVRVNVDFDFFSPYQDLQFAVPARSITSPADNKSSGFMAAGAVSGTWTVSPSHYRPGLALQETYSSEGPTLDRRVSPDLAAPDDVGTRTYLQAVPAEQRGPFAGTSASSPHLAGMAALVRGNHPGWYASDVETYLKANAVDSGRGGIDTAYGWGIAQLPYPTTPTVDVRRISGADRYTTSLAISRASFASGVATVVVATGAGYADALAGAPLAGCFNAPILLTQPTAASAALLAEVKRLGARHAIVLGGTAAVSSAVDMALNGAGVTTERLYGPTRIDTAAAIAKRIAKERGGSAPAVFVVNGYGYADSLSASAFAYHERMPIMPVYTNGIPRTIATTMRAIGAKSAVIVGSTNVVTGGVANALTGLAGAGSVDVQRFGGADRILTARALSAYGVAQGWGTYAYTGICTAYDYPDALTGAAATGNAGGVMLMTNGKILYPAEQRALTQNREMLSKVRVFGGGTSMSGSVLVQARMLANP